MLTNNSVPLLVLTGEDEDARGELHPRDNVIHETGLFLGRLGWTPGIALLEEGAVEFSNLHGLQQIRFERGNITAAFGDVFRPPKLRSGLWSRPASVRLRIGLAVRVFGADRRASLGGGSVACRPSVAHTHAALTLDRVACLRIEELEAARDEGDLRSSCARR